MLTSASVPRALPNLLIQWPDGEVSYVSGVPANQTYTASRDSLGSFLDCNRNGIDDTVDIASGSADINGDSIPDECQSLFIRGDANLDLDRDIADVITILEGLFSGAEVLCDDASDANDDGEIDIADSIALLGALFSAAPLPGPATCDIDASALDALNCATSGCR